MDEKIETLKKYIKEAKKIVFFGGAGVSTESGIPDFRSANGIFNTNLNAERIVSNSFFWSNTEEFYKFYKDKMMYLDAKPSTTHLKLKELEDRGKDITIITQNIDGLHQLAGSSKVLELHGTIHSNHCLRCHKYYDAKYVKEYDGIPRCSCGGLIKPDVVLYEETLDNYTIKQAIKAIEEADLLIVGGTSLRVYPAADFIYYFRGQKKVYINLENTLIDDSFLYIEDKLGNVFSKL